ncbi:MAG: cobalt-precorrin-5B (C(1))-methyltransferase [Euryarchaeota archaeon]|nr:cobalt-precorrin-5B (C(1))-methyltransferase [Euryarchaeota archaeon]
MNDPVNNFEIPPEWMRRAAIPEGELKAGITSGRLVLLADGSVLRRGYTTGTTAAAAAKAAVLSLRCPVDHVTVLTPAGINVVMAVKASAGRASATKDSGDHGFDVTNGVEIVAEARERESGAISIRAGVGIGIKKGVPAINPAPMRQIRASIECAVREVGISGVDVEICIPKGREIADQTLNSRVGIIGGISVLGTTGFVEPWNEHLLETKQELIKGSDRVVLTTGRIGMRCANMLFPDHTVVMVGNRISEGIAAAEGEIILCGLPGLILKWADPDILNGTGFLTIKEMIEDDPTNMRIDERLNSAKKDVPGVRIVLLNLNGSILRDTDP